MRRERRVLTNSVANKTERICGGDYDDDPHCMHACSFALRSRCVVVMVFSWTVKFITIDAATAADCGVCWCCVWWKAKMVEYGCIFPVSFSLSLPLSLSMLDAPHKTHSKIIVIIIINGFRRVHRMDTVYSNSHSTAAAATSAVVPSLAAWTANGIQSKHILITLSKMADQITVWCARAFDARRILSTECHLATRPPCPSPFD